MGADWRRFGDGVGGGAQGLPDAGAKSCSVGKKLRDIGIRSYGIVRIDSSCSPADWAEDPAGNTKKIAETFREACDIAESYGERLAAEGEICWGGMHSWKYLAELLEMVDRPQTLGMQADMAHTMLFTLGHNSPEDSLLPKGYDWSDKEVLYEALGKMTERLRPWVKDFHVAQNDATVKGSARTTRPDATACQTTRTARWTSSAPPGCGCATRVARRRSNSTSTGTAACFRTKR